MRDYCKFGGDTTDGAGIGSQAFAGTVSTGTVSHNFTGLSTDVSFVATEQRESFAGTVTDGAESISGASLSFSLCNDPGSFAGGIFTVTVDSNDIVSGTIRAADLGDDIIAGVDHETVSGNFLVTAGTGEFSDSTGYSDVFLAYTAENVQSGAGSGSFIIGALEPATLLISALGLFSIGLAKAGTGRREQPGR